MGKADVRWVWRALVVPVLISVLAAKAASGQDVETGWSLTAELSTVWTGGNSQAFTLGLGSTLEYSWERSVVRLEGSSVLTESSLTTRRAIGTSQEDFALEEETRTEKTAEVYYVRGRYDYRVSERLFVFAGADWLRNEFAGIESRFLTAVGVGNGWVSNDRVRLKTDYSATYTFQSDVFEDPFVKLEFPGLRLSYDLWWRLTGSADLESKLIADWNLDSRDDLRLDISNELPVAISTRLAFKPALQLLWRNEPSLTAVELVAQDGTPTGGSVLVQLERLDTFFTISLVVKV